MSQKTFVEDSLRMMDANFNRAKEGLRVCEDIARFHTRSKKMTGRLARLRHDLSQSLEGSKIKLKDLMDSRNVARDLGKELVLGPGRTNFRQVFIANAQRAKEALRVLEEIAKFFDMTLSRHCQRLRFRLYECEKEMVEKF